MERKFGTRMYDAEHKTSREMLDYFPGRDVLGIDHIRVESICIPKTSPRRSSLAEP